MVSEKGVSNMDIEVKAESKELRGQQMLKERNNDQQEEEQQQDHEAVVKAQAELGHRLAEFDSSEFDDDKEVSGSDAEGVWAPEIEQSFQEALAIYPPCGRRKIILSDEGKMYGRNELIARYIKLRTGKTRTRKQVSSHIQVLARRKMREYQAKIKVSNNGGLISSVDVAAASSTTASATLDRTEKEKALQSMQQMSSAQIVSAAAMHSKAISLSQSMTHQASLLPTTPTPGFWSNALQSNDSKSESLQSSLNIEEAKHRGMKNGIESELKSSAPASLRHLSSEDDRHEILRKPDQLNELLLGRCIATSRLHLVEFCAFVEQQREEETSNEESSNKHLFVNISGPISLNDPILEPIDVRQIQDKFPEKKGGLRELYERGPCDAFFLVKFWADLNMNIADEARAYYLVNTTYESADRLTIQVSTKVCSFGKQVVEKLEKEYARLENGRFVYEIQRSPMCEYMINFIHKLKHLPEKYMMNSVLENFTILHVVTNFDTGETLLCVAFVFEVSTSEHGAQHHIYRLVRD